MKLHELDTLKQQDKAERVLETRLGQTVSFSNLSLRESRHMLLRVRGLISEHRASAASHSSERDPAYLKLLMLESGLKGRLKEVAPIAPGQPGAAGAVPVDTKDPKVQAAMKKSQAGQTLNPEEQKLVGAVAASSMQKESRRGRRRLGESEIQQAQVVLAAQDMVDQIQKMLEQISAMQFKDLPALTDSIKNDMGVDQATAYQSATAAALTQLLQSVQQGKTALEGAQGTLTGQAPAVPGEEPAADMGMPPEGGDELNPAADMGMPPDEGGDAATDELGNATSLGRDRRNAGGMMEGTHTRTNTYRINGQDMIEYLANETGAQVEMRGDDVGILTVDTITFPRLAKLAADLAQQGKIKAIAGPATRDMTGRAVPVGGNYMSGPSRRDIGEASKKKGSKPDFLDVDKDGNKKEPFKKAVDDKKAGPKKGVNPFAKKK